MLAACSKPCNPDALMGSWKMRDAAPFPGEEITEKTTFFKNDSVITEMFLDGKRVEHYAGTYKLDALDKKLSVSIRAIDGGRMFDMKLVKLTNEELILERDGKEVVMVRP